MSDLTIRPAEGSWSVNAGGAELGESSAALELTEAGFAAVIYFPQEDLAMAFLEPSGNVYECPDKGRARYYNIVTKSRVIPNAAWCYDAPKPAALAIAGHIAFYPDFAVIQQA